MNLTIRPITAADYAALWRVLEPMIRAGETYTFPQDTTEADAIAYWTGPDRDTFVAANDEGAIVGTYYIKANQPGRGDHVCNCGYVTAPEATGKGVARAMCAHSLEQAKARGFRAMQFNFVIATNTRAVALWHSLGFQTVGRLPGAYHHPDGRYVDALVMWREV
jgi:ribosomal protein S18 acetylase RimI-like enzyme